MEKKFDINEEGYSIRCKLFVRDSDKTTLILTRNVYDQYKQTESYRQDLVKQAQEEAATWGNISGDVKSIIEEGNNYKDKIHQYNKEIDDEVMSDKLSRLEEIMNRIFEQVRKQPDTAPKLRKLMQYYLPTTTKLLEAYIELDRQPEAGTNITQTKKEIEDVLDTINDAFEQLLDMDWYRNRDWDKCRNRVRFSNNTCLRTLTGRRDI